MQSEMSPNLEKRRVLVVGNYRFTGKLLGKGNFARVEEAIHNILNVRVAIKVMDVNSIKEDYVIKHLYREARLMAKLSHPCIAALYQTMQRTDNVYYLVTEVAAGGDLCSFIKCQKNGRLDERPTRIYARQFVSALAHMHNIGVVHRDLKMENVMLNAAQTQIKIVDFGLGNIYNPDSPLKTHCGSPEYAAPELFVTGRRYGPEVDMWSLGIILYGMVIGQLPFVSSRNEGVSSQERRKKLVSQINKGLSNYHKRELQPFTSEFRCMVYRMLSAEASKRLTIKELMGHPWVTEKGKKIIKVNPIKIVDSTIQTRIISDICELTKKSFSEVVMTIKEEPMSRLGGMFNILAHRYALSKLSGDGVTKIPAACNEPQGTNKSPTRPSPTKPSPTRPMPYNLRSMTRAATAGASRSTNQRNTSSIYTTRGSTSQKRPSSESKPIGTAMGKVRSPSPTTLQSQQKEIDYRLLKSPTLRRKAYSAMITPKAATVRPAIVSPTAHTLPKAQNGKTANGPIKRICVEAGDAQKIAEVLKNGLRKMEEAKMTPIRAQTAVASDKKTKSKSERQSVTTRPVTTMSAVKRKLTKNAAVIPVNTTQSDSKTTNRPSVDIRPLTRMSKTRNSTQYTAKQLENSTLAFGDTSLQKQLNKKPTIYDPIASLIPLTYRQYVNGIPAKFVCQL